MATRKTRSTRTTRSTRVVRRATTQLPTLVKVARIGGAVQEVALNGEKTVADALEAAQVSASGSVRVNGKLVDSKALGDTVLSNGDIVTVAGKIAGGKN